MPNIADIKAEIDADSLGRGYSGMSDQQVFDDLNTAYRPAPGVSGFDVRMYCMLTKHTNGGTLYGRIQMLANNENVDDMPFGVTGALSAVTLDQVFAAKSIEWFLRYSDATLDMSNAGIDVIMTDMVNANAIEASHKTTIQALNQNKQTRAAELSLGSDMKVKHITEARAA